MYLRWKRRRVPGYDLLSAVVVASARTAAGPRQRYLCYVGSVRQSEWGSLRGHYACLFWAPALAALDRAGIRGADRERIEAELERAVARPADEAWAEELESVRYQRSRGWMDGAGWRPYLRALAGLFPDADIGAEPRPAESDARPSPSSEEQRLAPARIDGLKRQAEAEAGRRRAGRKA
jgi:hypothetical protein